MKDQKYYEQYIANIEDFPKKGILFRDIVPTLLDADAFTNLIDDLGEIAAKYQFDKIMCPDARGFLLGAALAYKMHKPLVIARKPNKLPRPGTTESYDLEYGSNTLVISKDSFVPGERVLVVDDLIATGGSAEALLNIVLKEKCVNVAALFYVELVDFKSCERLSKKFNIGVHSILKYEGE